MTAPSPFSSVIPGLQIAWDSSSLRMFLFCPRAYQYAIVQGWRGSTVDLEFGGYFASGVETFKKARAKGKSKDEAQLIAIRAVVEASWLSNQIPYEQPCPCPDGCNGCNLTGSPWGGYYEEQWRCLGETKFKNAKGNAAKCPFSHKGKWHPLPAPEVCSCGSGTEVQRNYVPLTPAKNRHTLVRLLAAYCDEQPDDLHSGFRPVVFNGVPAVELSWKLPLQLKTSYGEAFVLCGHCDSLETDGQEVFVNDNKTTKGTLTSSYWKQYAPNIQLDIYDLALTTLYPTLNVRGVKIEAAQVMVEGDRFGTQVFYRSDEQREEFLYELHQWLKLAETYAVAQYWPMNRTNCKMCQFQGICSKNPATRETFLRSEFEYRPWNPLEER